MARGSLEKNSKGGVPEDAALGYYVRLTG